MMVLPLLVSRYEGISVFEFPTPKSSKTDLPLTRCIACNHQHNSFPTYLYVPVRTVVLPTTFLHTLELVLMYVKVCSTGGG